MTTITLAWGKLLSKQTHTQTFDLDKPLTIGRRTNNTIVLDGIGVSRQHASIALENKKLLLKDSSTNGTWVQAQTITQSELKENMRFHIMDFQFRVKAIEVSVAEVKASKPTMEDKKPNAVQPSMDLVSIIKSQPYIENLLSLMPDKEEA